ncbi:hypothetical protein C8R45DRAFT_635981 [Mycena sanguinolenta]|nr:hypothetical protein C8R45DRAFT_635981 [Mycena sanguinolenta]
MPNNERIQRLVVPAADTLEHIHFVCIDPEQWKPPISLPFLCALRILEFKITSRYRKYITLILDIICAVFNSHTSDVLAEIVVTIPSWTPLPVITDSMTALDVALVAHPRAPNIWWRVYCAFENASGETYFAAFGDLLKLSFPKMHVWWSRSIIWITWSGIRDGRFSSSLQDLGTGSWTSGFAPSSLLRPCPLPNRPPRSLRCRLSSRNAPSRTSPLHVGRPPHLASFET